MIRCICFLYFSRLRHLRQLHPKQKTLPGVMTLYYVITSFPSERCQNYHELLLLNPSFTKSEWSRNFSHVARSRRVPSRRGRLVERFGGGLGREWVGAEVDVVSCEKRL